MPRQQEQGGVVLQDPALMGEPGVADQANGLCRRLGCGRGPLDQVGQPLPAEVLTVLGAGLHPTVGEEEHDVVGLQENVRNLLAAGGLAAQAQV